MRDLLKHTITVYATVTHNEYNQEVFSASNDFFGRFQLKNKLITNEKGEQILADAFCYMEKETVGLAIGGKITYALQDYRIIGLKEALDELSDVHHYELWLQRWQV